MHAPQRNMFVDADESEYAAARINPAQSCNGIGWIFGPVVGGFVAFYASGWPRFSRSTGLLGVSTAHGH